MAYSIKDVLKITGLSRTTIFKAMKEGRLRAKKCGRRVIVLCEDLAAFLNSLPDR